MTTIFLWLGTIIFALSSVYFYLKDEKKGSFNSAFLVSAITLVSHLVMIAGFAVTFNSNGDALYWTRWLGYIASCTLLMWVIAEHVGLVMKDKVELVYLTAITMLTGTLASITVGWMMILFFIVGGFTYVMMMGKIWKGDKKKLRPIKKYIYLGWSVFPLVFIISPEGFPLLPLWITVFLYLILDVFSKILFYIELEKKPRAARKPKTVK